MPGYRVLVHASERDRVPVALNNAKNLIAGLGVGAVEVRVVAYADGVEGLRASGPNTVLMGLLASHGAGFVVCANTLRSRNLTAEDFPDYVETVPSGVVEPVIRPALPPAVKKGISYASRTAFTTPSWPGLLTIRARPISVLMMAPLVRRPRRT